jgi:trimeric autotransporter adhesin
MTRAPRLIWSLCALLLPAAAGAQPIGTFSWQLQPFCNRVTVNVTQNGGIYTADGYDDQCGAPQRAPLVGLGTPNPDGTIGFGLHVVTVPGGRGVQIDARITLAALGGSWTDSTGNSGTFAFNANTGGSPRPAPTTGGGTTIPSNFGLLTDGGFVARGTAGAGTIPASGIGTRMMWHPNKAAFRAGQVTNPLWDDVNIGSHSTAFGLNSAATGPYGFAAGVDAAAVGISGVAIGNNVAANGNYSVAFGVGTRANGAYGTTFGRNTIADGDYSTALGYGARAFGPQGLAVGFNTLAGSSAAGFGYQSSASGFASLAAGFQAAAGGGESVALGSNVRTGANGSVVLGTNAWAQTQAHGSFLFGDRSTANDFVGTAVNEFGVRAAGGVYFYTNAALTTGQRLTPGSNQWAGHSDVNLKHQFRDIDGEEVLARIARMPVTEWSYLAQEGGIRHLGPTAQDFHAAFGLGEDPLYIGSMDADGVALAAVRALEARTRQTNERLTRDNDELRARLARLEALLEKR